MKVIRLPQVMAKTGWGRSTVWKKAKDGDFPAPFKIGPRTTVWDDDEVNEWLLSQRDSCVSRG